ncbi:MAG: DegQ family serine endoprotease [candidate division KSB1 bacterium]|nr:DegQ family serine endoprotease [candidate division KSB1 bacterium]MDZ7356782.1 DegQ family serine endoprotease [candidate division KSB1 bacterium]
MAMSNRNIALLVLVGILGVIAGLIISANFNLIFNGFASNEPAATKSIQADYRAADSPASIMPADPQLSSSDALVQLEQAYIQVAENVKPWVVTITSAKIIRYRQFFNPWDEFFNFFGEPDQRRRRDDSGEREFRQEGLGSGVIVSSDGYILTNNHVVQEADEIRVITADKKDYVAKLVGRDEKTDVAVVKIDAKNLPFARMGDSDKIRVGQIVMAIGNPFSQQLQQTVTEGIISAKGRSNIGIASYEDFIQTTAAINPGNSGGALVNLRGELIGINTAIVSQSGGFNGIGFAIPINMARRVMEILIDKGYVVRGYLGVTPQAIDEEMVQALGLENSQGALIASVEKGTPADKAGLKEQDVVLEVDGRKVVDDNDFRLRIAERNPGDKVRLKIVRDGKIKEITVTLTERPDDRPPAQMSARETEKLGIRVANLTRERARQYGFEDDEEGVIVVGVDQGSAASRKGIRVGDLIISVNRQPVTNVREYESIIDELKPGDVVFMRLKRVIRGTVNHFYVTIRVPR